MMNNKDYDFFSSLLLFFLSIAYFRPTNRSVMSANKKTSNIISTNKKREENANRTYTVERLLKRRKRKVRSKNSLSFHLSFFQGRTEYLVKWKHYDKSHNSWEPEENILDTSLIDIYKKQKKSPSRRTSSPKKLQSTDLPAEKEEEEEPPPTTTFDYWYPPNCEQKAKIAITDITSDNVTITFREFI